MFPSFRSPLVLVGLSGGVDSAVAAALLKQRGFRVVGGFIKNWSETTDAWTGECSWKHERRDALRVAAALDIPLVTFDFETQYRERVVAEMVRGYAAGETPNPDVLCNEAIKFGLFLDEARKIGADFVATGHYARIRRGLFGGVRLLRGRDPDKDQSYFLHRVPQDALRRALFPVGGMTKAEVRATAARLGLPVADKPDSQGVCFIGKLDMGDFLRTRIPSRPGEIVDVDGKVVGRHDGLEWYTVGQREGIGISSGGRPWYAAGKDVKANRLIVVAGNDHPRLFRSDAVIRDLHWTRGRAPRLPVRIEIQVRYRQPPVRATVSAGPDPETVRAAFDGPVKAVAPGQSAVFYRGDECLGGGIIV